MDFFSITHSVVGVGIYRCNGRKIYKRPVTNSNGDTEYETRRVNDPRQVLKIRNSWSQNWGTDEGHIYVELPYRQEDKFEFSQDNNGNLPFGIHHGVDHPTMEG